MELEITGKMKKVRPRKSWEESIKNICNDMDYEERMRSIKRNGNSKLRQKLPAPASHDNVVKADVVVIVYIR